MFYLLFSVVCSTLIFVTFKAFSLYKINNVYAIVVNYIVAAALGFAVGGLPENIEVIVDKEWLFGAFLIGFLFITLFQIMALTAQRLGVSRVSVPVKMSVALPVIAGVWLYNERLSFWAIIGVVLALLAVYLGTKSASKQVTENSKWLFVLPLILFFGNGSIDVMLKYAQHSWLQSSEMALFSSLLFTSAFIWGIFFVIHKWGIQGVTPTGKDILAGIVLGIPNFGSIYFLLEALDKSGMPSAYIYPINNVAIVGLSAVFGLLIFKEHLTKINVFGLLCGFISIFLIAYA